MSNSSAYSALYDEWRLIDHCPPTPEEEKESKGPFYTFMQTTKAMLYNMYQSRSTGDSGVAPSSPVFLLGMSYQPGPEKSGIEEFQLDFASRLWFTYRQDFAKLEGSTWVTDMGWGCMIRTAQMMLAQAFIVHFLGRNWRHIPTQSVCSRLVYRNILRWFLDSPSLLCPYSIHHVVRLATRFDYKCGECMGPTLVARVFKMLVRNHSPDGIVLYVPDDGVVYADTVASLCTNPFHDPPPTGTDAKNSAHFLPISVPGVSSQVWRPLIIWIPLRLGVDRVNPIYIPCLKAQAYLQWKCTLGFIGGKPNSSYYFVGFQDDKLFYLDPHLVQPCVKLDKDFNSETFHCTTPKRLSWDDLDPSLALGFYCRNQAEFLEFRRLVDALARTHPPVFTVEESNPNYEDENNA